MVNIGRASKYLREAGASCLKKGTSNSSEVPKNSNLAGNLPAAKLEELAGGNSFFRKLRELFGWRPKEKMPNESIPAEATSKSVSNEVVSHEIIIKPVIDNEPVAKPVLNNEPVKIVRPEAPRSILIKADAQKYCSKNGIKVGELVILNQPSKLHLTFKDYRFLVSKEAGLSSGRPAYIFVTSSDLGEKIISSWRPAGFLKECRIINPKEAEIRFTNDAIKYHSGEGVVVSFNIRTQILEKTLKGKTIEKVDMANKKDLSEWDEGLVKELTHSFEDARKKLRNSMMGGKSKIEGENFNVIV